MRFLRKTAGNLTLLYERCCPVVAAAYFLWTALSLMQWNDPAYAGTAALIMKALRVIYAVPMAGVIACGWVLKPKRALYQVPILIILLWSHTFFRVSWLLDVFLFAFASRYVNGGRMLKATCLSWFAILLMTAVLLLTGLTKNRVIDFRYAVGQSFGLLHPNTAGIALLSTALAVWCAFLQKKPVATAILFWAAAAAAWFLCASRTSALLLAVFPVLYGAVLLLRKNGRDRVLKLSVFLPAALMLLSLALTLCALSGSVPMPGNFLMRFRKAAAAIRQYGIRPLGSPVELGGKMILDNQYMYWLICQGILPTLLILGLDTCMMHRFASEKAYGPLLVCVICLGLGFMENLSVWPIVNAMPLILLCGEGKIPDRENTAEEKIA